MAENSNESLLNDIANGALSTMVLISKRAHEEKMRKSGGAGTTMATMNSFNDLGVIRNLSKTQRESFQAYQSLEKEPFLSRVTVLDENEKRKTFYFARNYTVGGVSRLGSYKAPLGRLAALEVGDPFTLPDGSEVEVIETGKYSPIGGGDHWDSKNSKISHEFFDETLVPSLRALFKEKPEIDDPFAVIEDTMEPRWGNVARDALRGTGLRDQAILDKEQDEIFRLPLASRLMLQGPPGTGKTTTLIKRLSQKLNLPDDMYEDQKLVESATLPGGPEHEKSWIMFTPTELLELYLKDAFNREDVAADTTKVVTWSAYRKVLARNTLGFLRTAAKKSGFSLEDSVSNLSANAPGRLDKMFAEFDAHQHSSFIEKLRAHSKKISESGEGEFEQIGTQLNAAFSSPSSPSLQSVFLSVDGLSQELRSFTKGIREEFNSTVDRKLNSLARQEEGFVHELDKYVKALDTVQLENEDSDVEDLDEEDNQETLTSRDRLFRAFRQSVRARAISVHRGRSVTKSSKYYDLVKWLGDRAFSSEEYRTLGRAIDLAAAANAISAAPRNYFSQLANRYRDFRKSHQEWYSEEKITTNIISSEELDIVVAVYLQAAQDLLASRSIRSHLDQGNLQFLLPLISEFRNQVVVDEATDFSSVQLRAMYNLTNPSIRSFFACGDFNQRLTTTGVTQESDLQWAVPNMELRSVKIGYRQSLRLQSFADEIISRSGGTKYETLVAAKENHEGVDPALFVEADGQVQQSEWIADRIKEIDGLHEQMPSVAVFVPAEENVSVVATELKAALVGQNIDVVLCHEGRSLGRDTDIRVFAVEHIKGLEFEAAFFHSIDFLAEREPGLFDKYLYVGATRAATFLGLACTESQPDLLAQVKIDFVNSWEG